MGTLIKTRGSIPSMAKKTVNKFFDDFITKDFDWSDKKFAASENQQPTVNLKETDSSTEVELAPTEIKIEDLKVEIGNDLQVNSAEEKVEKKDPYVKKEFNYRSFCRLPNL